MVVKLGGLFEFRKRSPPVCCPAETTGGGRLFRSSHQPPFICFWTRREVNAKHSHTPAKPARRQWIISRRLLNQVSSTAPPCALVALLTFGRLSRHCHLFMPTIISDQHNDDETEHLPDQPQVLVGSSAVDDLGLIP